MSAYIGIIHKDADSDFSVCFPDFPGCITAGTTLDEAGKMAQEALSGHIETMREDKYDIPEPMTFEDAHKHEFAEGALSFIVVNVQDPESDTIVRINISIRKADLQKIDKAAANSHRSRSSYLVERALGR